MAASTCHYGILARVHVEEEDFSSEDEELGDGWFKPSTRVLYKTDSDLLLALGDADLFLFRRKPQETRSCACISPQELGLDCSAQQRLASSFQCPHVTAYDYYEQWAAVAYSSIAQVQLTFRTVSVAADGGSSDTMAERTKDCVIIVEDGSRLWLEFEHNLARGAFLDALMASSAPHVTLDLDYTDLGKPNPLELDSQGVPRGFIRPSDSQEPPRMVFDFQRAASRLAVMLALQLDADDLEVAMYGEPEDEGALQGLPVTLNNPDQPRTSSEFRRIALRMAVQTRIQLVLQLSNELTLEDPHYHFLLGSAMELSRALDEPDLHALTWLVSGFMNLQRALLVTPPTSTRLAREQLEYAIALAREHSLRLQLALALACCGDLHRVCKGEKSAARKLLVEAARLMPSNALDAAEKMQLHNKIHSLGLALSPRKNKISPSKDDMFDLWKALATAMSAPQSVGNSKHQTQHVLLNPVVKNDTGRARFCFVEVEAGGNDTRTRTTHRMRVFFTEGLTFEWLREDVLRRCDAVPLVEVDSEGEGSAMEVDGFYAANDPNQEVIPWSAHVEEIARLDGHVIRALTHQGTCFNAQNATGRSDVSSPARLSVAAKIARHTAEYTPTYQRFVLKQKAYAQQFSHIYVSRLQQLRDTVARQVELQSDSSVAILPKVIDLKADGKECVLIGTLLKVLAGKPDLFDALTSEGGVTPIEKMQTPLATTEDELLLEDESGRVELVGGIDVARMVTGVVLGVRGRVPSGGTGGQFHVEQVYVPSFPPQHPLPERAESEYVALVAGLSIGRNTDSQPLRNHLLMDYLAGRFGDGAERQFVAKIVRTVVVGNSIEATEAGESVQAPSTKRKTVEQLALDAEPLKNADELMSTLAAAICVDLMPGPSDPSNYALPQQSFHPCLFPRSSHFKSFRCVTNPYEAQIGGVQLFGHAGQPLRSMLQCTLPKDAAEDDEGDVSMTTEQDKDEQEQERALDCLQQCLEWRHAAPTTPDLVACFPMANDDPFILETCPHVLFAGNQPRFSTRLVKGANGQEVRLITVPSFAETSTIVLLDLKDLSCFPMTIDV
ncbi:hypothetical protein BBJ28_00002408 [Nothophytophthora sp. Chile5]|nr:hypothetical protein BBJ28_00002408 [Nothophytophthora sp. Chile5]